MTGCLFVDLFIRLCGLSWAGVGKVVDSFIRLFVYAGWAGLEWVKKQCANVVGRHISTLWGKV
jgi:hypothetical protein